MKFSFLLIAFLACMIGTARAEQGCPPGQYPIGGQGAAACAPIPQENQIQQQPAVPSGEWIKTWGAISIGSVDSTTIYGVTTGKLSKSEAEEDSLRRCSSRAKDNCKVIFSYRNQCVALAEPQIDGRALSTGIIKYISAGTINEASVQAAKDCSMLNKKTTEAKCKVAYTACTEPIFHKY
ncbi:DUF4189 domain-containing protein [Xanthomonas campestris pv. phormiicola]|nr:DUF4189 domain-containing protein [Xanthomonas campestris pv. phormiicola]UYC16190.1 DUF4189 domain-containing protein [Xanthomonas campestris pv. phormiicola]